MENTTDSEQILQQELVPIFSISTGETNLPGKQLYQTGHVPGVGEHDRHEVCAERLVPAALLLAQNVDLHAHSLIGR